MKNYIIILIIVFALILILPKMRMSETKTKSGKMFTEDDAKKAIFAVKQKYGVDIARTVEKMYRNETKHFQSTQYKQTGTAGMEVGKWGNDVPKNLPTIKAKDPVLGMREFIVWNPTDFALFLASYIKKYNGNFARWNSTNVDKQKKYAAAVNAVTAKFV